MIFYLWNTICLVLSLIRTLRGGDKLQSHPSDLSSGRQTFGPVIKTQFLWNTSDFGDLPTKIAEHELVAQQPGDFGFLEDSTAIKHWSTSFIEHGGVILQPELISI